MLFLIPAIIFLVLWLSEKKKHAATQSELQRLRAQLQNIGEDFDSFRLKYAKVTHAEAEAEKIRKEAEETLLRAKITANDRLAQANSTSAAILSRAKDEAKRIRNDALQASAQAGSGEKFAQLDIGGIISKLNADTTTVPAHAFAAPSSVIMPEGIISAPQHTPSDDLEK